MNIPDAVSELWVLPVLPDPGMHPKLHAPSPVLPVLPTFRSQFPILPLHSLSQNSWEPLKDKLQHSRMIKVLPASKSFNSNTSSLSRSVSNCTSVPVEISVWKWPLCTPEISCWLVRSWKFYSFIKYELINGKKIPHWDMLCFMT